MKRNRSSIGFTVVEVLVVLAIIGVLTALLLPAVQMAREAARRSGCTTRLRQIGMAIHAYESVHQQYPAGRIAANGLSTGRSVFVALLPFVEQAMLYETFNLERPSDLHENSTSAIRRPGLYACPSDAGANFAIRFGPGSGQGDGPGGFRGRALTSYVTVFGAYPLETNISTDGNDRRGQKTGCFNDIQSVRGSDVSDGLSRTAFVTERNLWVVNNGGARFKIPADHHLLPNSPLPWTGLWVATYLKETMLSLRLPPNPPMSQEISQTLYEPSSIAGSAHPAGLNVLLGDGSVRFVNDAIDSWPAKGRAEMFGFVDAEGYFPSPPPTDRLWQALATRCGSDDRTNL